MASKDAMAIAEDAVDSIRGGALARRSDYVDLLARAIDELRVRDLGEVLELCAFEDQFIIDLLRNKLTALRAAMDEKEGQR